MYQKMFAQKAAAGILEHNTVGLWNETDDSLLNLIMHGIFTIFTTTEKEIMQLKSCCLPKVTADAAKLRFRLKNYQRREEWMVENFSES